MAQGLPAASEAVANRCNSTNQCCHVANMNLASVQHHHHALLHRRCHSCAPARISRQESCQNSHRVSAFNASSGVQIGLGVNTWHTQSRRTTCAATGSVPSLVPPSQPFKPQKTEAGTGVYILMLINAVLFFLDHVLHLPFMQSLYLSHAHPQWYTWITHMFCHANYGHLANNLFFLLTFGRLVEDIEGSWGVVFVYLICGAGAALASFLLSPRNVVSVGASGAIFGLFAVSVLTRLTNFNFRRLLESVVLGQFVIRQVLDEVKQQVAGGAVVGGLRVSHLAHLGGAMAGVLLVLLLHAAPGEPDKQQ